MGLSDRQCRAGCDSRAACPGQLTDMTSEALLVVSLAASSPARLPHLIILIVFNRMFLVPFSYPHL